MSSADPEVRQQEWQEREQEKAIADKSRVEAAEKALEENEIATNEEEVAAVPQTQQEEPKEQEGQEEESKSALYSRLAEQDFELQQLKKQMKQKGQANPLDELKQKAKENPAEILQSLGIGLDEAIDMFVDSPDEVESAGDPQLHEPQTNEELVALQQKIDAMESAQRDKEYNAHVQNEQQRVHEIVNREDAKWPIVKALAQQGSYKDVLDTAMAIYQQNLEENPNAGQEALPQYNVVLDMVEDYYYQNMEQMIQTMSSIEKFKHFFSNNGKQQQQQMKPKEQEKTPVKKSATITSAWNDTASPHEPNDEERKKNAVAALEAAIASQQND